MMQVRDRVKELRRVRASDLAPSPKNWRMHPKAQQDALRGLLAEVGFADALLARELSDGQLILIDGHLRAETTPDAIVPVLVLDVTEAEADKLLVALDPLAGMAEADADKLAELLKDVETDSEALQALFDGLASEAGIESDEEGGSTENEGEIPEQYSVLVECETEQQQAELLRRLDSEGYKCRSLIS